jgi:hypothetical protein
VQAAVGRHQPVIGRLHQNHQLIQPALHIGRWCGSLRNVVRCTPLKRTASGVDHRLPVYFTISPFTSTSQLRAAPL